jgi:hypothetical protein
MLNWMSNSKEEVQLPDTASLQILELLQVWMRLPVREKNEEQAWEVAYTYQLILR